MSTVAGHQLDTEYVKDQYISHLQEKLRWQPIDTAPKNEVIWACDAVRGYDGKVMYAGGEWMCINFNQFGMDIGFYPTHWMPLPTLPKPSGGAA